MEGIVSYVGTNYKNFPMDFTMALEDMELTDPAEPMALNPGDHVAFECWKVQFMYHHEEI